MKKILKWATKHLIILLIGSIMYALSFQFDFLSFSGIYFYDGIVRLAIVVLLLTGVMWCIRKSFSMDYKDVALAICLCALVNMLWLSLCVVSLDRSLSVFMLCYMQENEKTNPSGMTEEELDEIFNSIFVNEYGMLERRFDEQLVSGNIFLNDGRYELSERGEFIVRVFKTVGKMYNVDDRFIEPEVVK